MMTEQNEQVLQSTAIPETKPEKREIIVSGEAGGLDIRALEDAYRVAQFMAGSGPMVPGYCRGNPGVCFGHVIQALEWRMSPFQVARMSYLVQSRKSGDQTIGYMSQLTHAVIEARAPLKERLRIRYEGEGDDRVCIVSGHFRGQEKPVEHKSPRLKDRRPARGEKRGDDDEDNVRGSPLWYKKPDVQLAYDTVRDWARIYAPDVLMGIYSDDELIEAGYQHVADPRAPALEQVEAEKTLESRLSSEAISRAGFSIDHVNGEVDKLKTGEPAKSGDKEAVADAVHALHASKEEEKIDTKPSSSRSDAMRRAWETRRARKARAEEPTEAEIERSQERIGAVLEEAEQVPVGPEHVRYDLDTEATISDMRLGPEQARYSDVKAKVDQHAEALAKAAPAPAATPAQPAPPTQAAPRHNGAELQQAILAGRRYFGNGYPREYVERRNPNDPQLRAAELAGWDERAKQQQESRQ